MDQLKLYVEDTLSGNKIELYHHTRGYKALETEPDEWEVEEILGHRRGAGGRWEFLTKWEGTPPGEETWEPLGSFVQKYCYPWVKYARKDGVMPELAGQLAERP